MAYTPFRTGDATIDRNLDSIASNLNAPSNAAIITGWTLYTPMTQGFGTIAAPAFFYWRRVGEDLQVRGYFVAGTVTGSEARIGLPQSPVPLVSAGANLIPAVMMAGYGSYGYGPGIDLASTILIGPSKPYFNMSYQNASNPGLSPLPGNGVLSSTSLFSFFASCPITGWSPNV